MEDLLHYVWRHKFYPLKPLRTTDGQELEVIDPGLPNRNAGPDFFNAKVKIGGTMWAGNVEVHLKASDWLAHGHDRDTAYDNVVLHVVGEYNCDVFRTNGERIPQMLLTCPEEVRILYGELRHTEIFPPCYSILSGLSKLKVHAWLSALQAERFEQKAQVISRRLERSNNNWEDVFFVTLARNFGFGLNGDAFEAWANSLPLRAVDKHRDNLFQVEAFFFGLAGLLEEGCVSDDYSLKLQREYRYLQHKFGLPSPLPASQWRFLRLRPGNFPHVRLAQLACLYSKERSLFSRVMEAETTDDAELLLKAGTSPYWEEHFNFGKASPRREKTLGKRALDLIMINTVIPFLHAYGKHKSDEQMCRRASRFLEELKAEDNRIIRTWCNAGLPVSTAADSQALIQLQKEYCDKKDCLRCRFGYEYLTKGRRPASCRL